MDEKYEFLPKFLHLYQITLKHKDGSVEQFDAAHTYNDTQIEWFKAGSALNYSKMKGI